MERDTLRRIDQMAQPRHLSTLPEWAKPETLDRLILEGYVTFSELHRAKGAIDFARGLELTPKGRRKVQSALDWPHLALKGSLAGASFTAMSFVLLYLA